MLQQEQQTLTEQQKKQLRVAARLVNAAAQRYGIRSAEYAQAKAAHARLCKQLGV